MAPDYFMLFGKLPAELRLAVWECYALPSTPMVHTFCLSHSHDSQNNAYITSKSVDVPLHRHEFFMVRALMQTNREARTAILQGRKLQLWHYASYVVTPYPWEPRQEYIYRKLFFVDWEKDLFHLKFKATMSSMFGSSTTWFLRQMKRIVLDLRGLWYNAGLPYVNGFKLIFDRTWTADIRRFLFPSLEHVTLALSEPDTFKLFCMLDDASSLYNEDKRGRMRRYGKFLQELSREANNNGLYPTGPNDQRFAHLILPYPRPGASHRISFGEWATIAVAVVKQDLLELFGETIDVEIKLVCDNFSRIPRHLHI
ncbi:hypothetical protein GGR57DRAFT_513345 [Xylariaceae sp. FL1272]|nr:hypothetical protein GGR57DRAFT_513345 [Xylariaceae sp. FL1272]